MQIGIMFEQPWALAAIPFALAFVLLTSKKLKSASLKTKAIRGMRILLLAILVLALASPIIDMKAKETVTIFMADVSDSVRQPDEMAAFIRDAVKQKSDRDKTGVIAFAQTAQVKKMPDDENDFSDLGESIPAGASDLEKALTLARSVMPGNAAKRLVLMTDGKQTTGDALEAARLLRRQGYTLDVAPFLRQEEPEIQMESFEAPKQVNAGERFDVTVKVSSNTQTAAVIRLYGNRQLTAEKTVELYKGENVFTFSDIADEGGMVTYTAEAAADSDTVYQNNQLSAFTQVADRPGILVIENGHSGENIVRYLEGYAQVTRVQPDEVPRTLQGLLACDATVMADISAEWLDPDFLILLEQAVRYQGKGLLTLGGENSYAPGGYKDTPLETLLPVDMDIRPKEENPNLGLLLVIDKSGSMSTGQYGISKVELAKEAAIRATEVLDDKDSIGVIAFDDAIQWVVPTEKLTERDEVTDMIGSIRAGGGTQILPPLEEAWQSLRETDAKLKHIILLTDGQAEQYGYEKIIDGLREDGITLSTVAVGSGADTLLLKALAYGGQGRYYQTDEFSDIPSIFAKEAFLAGQKYLQNRHFFPEAVTSMGFMRGIEAIPPLDGYVSTRIKAAARTVFQSDTQEPVLAVWQYGLGRTAAWTSDIQGIWTSQWVSWQEASAFWGNLAGWLIQKNLSEGYTIQTALKDGKGVVTLQTDGDIMLYEDTVKGTLVAPDGARSDITLNVTQPGQYEGDIPNTDPGAYVVDLEVQGEDGTEHVSTGLVMPYSQEYRLIDDHSAGFLEKLAQAGGGSVISSPEDVLKGQLQQTGGKRSLTWFLTLLALCILLADIALRKLQIRLEPVILFWNDRIAPGWSAVIQKMRSHRAPAHVKPRKSQTPAGIHDALSKLSEPVTKQPEPPPISKPTPGRDSDSINALLNRRKQYK